MKALNRAAVEQVALDTIPHNFAEWVDTGGGVFNVIFHTVRDELGTEVGPQIAVGPFSQDGEQEFPGVVFVSVETRNDEGIECPTVGAVEDALRLLFAS